MAARTGLDRLVGEGFARLAGKRLGVLCNQASVDCRLDHLLDLLRPLHEGGRLKIGAAFGPQHGMFGHTQDNMVEWEGGRDRQGWPVVSLYGEHRQPTDEMLASLDLLLIDLQDVGARYYTFIWTMALCMRACERTGTPVMVLDRPNPLGGLAVEGTVLSPEYVSFVGLHPLPMRHGMTIGEIARYFADTFVPHCELTVVEMEGWEREMRFEHTGLPWVMPSPNMPTPETARVYPGMCLLEGTNLSEGRGTTRPFETIGAPFLDRTRLCPELERANLSGVKFRPVQFEPTFQKHARTLCDGCFIHVLDPASFSPVAVAVAILQETIRHSDAFRWNDPPYEYEAVKRPIDILAGNGWLAAAIESLGPLPEIEDRFAEEIRSFAPARNHALMY